MKSVVELQNISTGEMSCHCDYTECTANVAPRAKINIQALRYLVGHPLKINRSCSCKAYNSDLGGADGSKHVPENCEYHHPDANEEGSDGFDIQVNPYLAGLILRYAPFLGFNGIGVKERDDDGRITMVHIDMRPVGETAVWGY